MRGMKSEDLMAVVDFIYLGETNVQEESLNTFMSIAEELQLQLQQFTFLRFWILENYRFQNGHILWKYGL